ncbi:MAG: hypothetical protein ACRCZI_07670 [Cetobacterium sp.]
MKNHLFRFLKSKPALELVHRPHMPNSFTPEPFKMRNYDGNYLDIKMQFLLENIKRDYYRFAYNVLFVKHYSINHMIHEYIYADQIPNIKLYKYNNIPLVPTVYQLLCLFDINSDESKERIKYVIDCLIFKIKPDCEDFWKIIINFMRDIRVKDGKNKNRLIRYLKK